MAQLVGNTITVRGKVDVTCPACGAQQAYVEVELPVVEGRTADRQSIIVEIGPAPSPLRLRCAGCGRWVGFTQQLEVQEEL